LTLPDDAPRVVIETSLGTIVIGLYEERAPITVANFLAYVDAGFFDGTVFHRVMPGFMVQGGGFVHRNEQYIQKETMPPIVLEADTGLKNLRGTVTMARTPAPDSATAQFFVNLVDNQRLWSTISGSIGLARSRSATQCSAWCSKEWTWSMPSPRSKPSAGHPSLSRPRRWKRSPSARCGAGISRPLLAVTR